LSHLWWWFCRESWSYWLWCWWLWRSWCRTTNGAYFKAALSQDFSLTFGDGYGGNLGINDDDDDDDDGDDDDGDDDDDDEDSDDDDDDDNNDVEGRDVDPTDEAFIKATGSGYLGINDDDDDDDDDGNDDDDDDDNDDDDDSDDDDDDDDDDAGREVGPAEGAFFKATGSQDFCLTFGDGSGGNLGVNDDEDDAGREVGPADGAFRLLRTGMGGRSTTNAAEHGKRISKEDHTFWGRWNCLQNHMLHFLLSLELSPTPNATLFAVVGNVSKLHATLFAVIGIVSNTTCYPFAAIETPTAHHPAVWSQSFWSQKIKIGWTRGRGGGDCCCVSWRGGIWSQFQGHRSLVLFSCS
jgi:hypothetical protein